ncbi:hypothetical protein MHYP_G00192230 [Metynnis hypsauchen]
MDSTKKVTKKLAGAAARTAAWATNVGNEHGQVAETIKQRRERSAKADDCLVGFGAHKTCTYKELYESADREKKSYVQCLRGQSCKLGSKMDTLKKYIQKRDVDKAMPGCSLPRPGPSRVQSPKAEPTDDELMACALEVDIPALAEEVKMDSTKKVTKKLAGAAARTAAWATNVGNEHGQTV